MTGGHIGSAFLDSTEIYRNNAWTPVAAILPVKMIDMKATTVDNKVLVFGMHDFLFKIVKLRSRSIVKGSNAKAFN